MSRGFVYNALLLINTRSLTPQFKTESLHAQKRQTNRHVMSMTFQQTGTCNVGNLAQVLEKFHGSCGA